MEALQYLKVLRRRWYIPIVAALLGITAAWLTTPESAGPPARSYTATHTLYSEDKEGYRQYSLDTIALLGTAGVIPERVAERLGEPDAEPALLASEVDVVADSKVGTLTVQSTQRDGDRAAEVANTFAAEIVAYFDQQEQANQRDNLDRTIDQMEKQEERIRELDAEIADLSPNSGEAGLLAAEREALLRQYGASVETVQQLGSVEEASVGLITLQAAVPVPIIEGGFEPPRSRTARVGIAGIVGLILGVGLVILLDQVDTRVRTRRGAERAFRLPVVSEIPKTPTRRRRGHTVITSVAPGSGIAEAFRILRLSIQLMPRWILPTPSVGSDGVDDAHERRRLVARPSGPATVVLVTSPGPGEGKTTTVANLAASFAEVGKVVLVVDCDFRHPEQHQYLKTERAPGVSDFLARGSDRPSLQDLALPTVVPGVWLVPNGATTGNPGQLVGPDQDLIASAAELADVVLVDAGPVLAVTDPAALVPRADAVVVVARSGQTTAEAAHRTSELLARLEAPVLGVVLVGVPRSSVASRYYDESTSAGKGRPSEEQTPDELATEWRD